MPNEKNYLDDLPGVSGYAFGKFHLDDLDFADDPLKRKIDFIDDALLAPPKPNADITSGVKTSREVMGERKPQPTDEVGMRPEDYIRKRPPRLHIESMEEHKEESRASFYEAPAPRTYPREAPVRSAAASRTRPSGAGLEEAYERYKARKQAEAGSTVSAVRSGIREPAFERMPAGRRTAGMKRTPKRRNIVTVVMMIVFIYMVVTTIFGIVTENVVEPEPAGFAGQTEPEVVVDPPAALEEQWRDIQDVFAMICENPETAEEYVGLTLYDIGITDEMREYLVDSADTVFEEDDGTRYETRVNEYDIDYYEYEEYAWLRFWSNDYDDVADIAFYYEDMVIQVIDVNGERMAELG